MSEKQYDASEEMIKLFKLKQQQRQQTKAYFRRIIENPHRPVTDGTPFDPVLHRFSALGAYQIDHFRPNSRNILQLLGFFIIPYITIATAIRHFRTKNDRYLRDGNVAYKDRDFKLV